jgi:oligopeptidase B
VNRRQAPKAAAWAVALGVSLGAVIAAQVATPPIAETRVDKTEVLHGDARADEYAWLGDKSNPRVIAHLEAENAYTAAVMKPTEALQERLYTEMLGRIKQTDLSVPSRKHGYYYYSRTEEGKQYPVVCRKKGSLDAAEEVVLDGNERAAGQKFWALGSTAVSDDGALFAFAEDVTGFRQYTLRVKDLHTAAVMPFIVERVTSVVWAADSRTLFFTTEDATTKRSNLAFRHVLGAGAPQQIYDEADERFDIGFDRSRSEAFVFLQSGSRTTSEVRYLRSDRSQGEFRIVAPRRQDIEYDVEHRGDEFLIRVNDTGRNFRLVSAPTADPSPAKWTEVVPHRPNVMLEGVLSFKDHVVLFEREQGLSQLTVRDPRSGASHRVGFPEPVYSVFPTGNNEFDTKLLRYSYQSFVTPPSVFDYDMESRQATLLKQTEVLGGYDASRYDSERIYVLAADGVQVPVSLLYKKGTPRDGSAPLLLGGYGAYGIPSDVLFSSNVFSLVDRGVVVATAHVRGGGDLGKAWHDAGRMLNKKNTFTDFVAVAEHLVAKGYTSKEKLVIQGGSAGGLLIGAVVNMRPDLFKAAILQVPFVDVINTMMDESLPLTVAEFEEWGNPKNKAEYDYIKTYSPYDNLSKKAYPAILVKTSLNDSQVMYWEPAKYVARLRRLKTDPNPLLFKVNMAAGHGGASGRYDRLREVAFDYAFVLWQVSALGKA